MVTCWERAGLLALVCDILLWVCYFPIGILGQVWYLIVSISDLCPLSYFVMRNAHFFYVEQPTRFKMLSCPKVYDVLHFLGAIY